MAIGRKTGGRQKGTPNKPNPLKEHLRAQSMSYFEPKPQTNPDGTPRKIDFRDKDGNLLNSVTLKDEDGKPLFISDFEIDMMMMEPRDRATIQEKLLRYHTPQMQSISAELSSQQDVNITIEQKLKKLAEENEK